MQLLYQPNSVDAIETATANAEQYRQSRERMKSMSGDRKDTVTSELILVVRNKMIVKML